MELHNYQMANSVKQKTYNWSTLNRIYNPHLEKVFRKMGFMLDKSDIEAVISCQNEAVEKIMRQLKIQVEAYDQQIFMQKEAKNTQKQQL